MALFLITSLIDEGMYDNDYRVVEAESREEVAQHMIDHPNQWQSYLRSALLLAYAEQPDMTVERFLTLIDSTHVDGDSAAQLRIFEVQVEQLAEVDTAPFRQWKQDRE
jgi:hypothetical protein